MSGTICGFSFDATGNVMSVYFKIHNRHSAKLMMNRNIIFFGHCLAGFICLDFYWQRRIRKLRVSIIISNVIVIVFRSSFVEFTPFFGPCMSHTHTQNMINIYTDRKIPLSNIRDIFYIYMETMCYIVGTSDIGGVRCTRCGFASYLYIEVFVCLWQWLGYVVYNG